MRTIPYHLFLQYFAGLSSATGSFILGTVIGWTAQTEHSIKAGDLGYEVSDREMDWLSTIFTLGAASMCIPTGFIIDAIGRRFTMLLFVPFLLLGWLMIAFSVNTIMLYVARFLLGMSGGAFCIIAPLYTTEIAQTKIRGILGCFFQMLITMGILYSYIMGAVCTVFVMTLSCTFLPVISGILFLILPESPFYYVMKDKPEKARSALQWLRGKNYDINEEYQEVEANVREVKENPVSLLKGMKRRSSLRAFLNSICLMIFQQFSGINVIMFYATDVFKLAKTGLEPKVSTIVLGAVQVIATFAALFLIDRLGRRILLMLSSFVMSLSTLGLGIYFYIKDRDTDIAQRISWFPVLCCCLFILMFSLGMGAVPWLIMAETFAEDIKGPASSISATINWLSAFTITNAYGPIKNAIGVGQTFWIYSGFSITCTIFVFFFLPETHNKTFAEIQQSLDRKKK
uniref:Major facilitator superfamily (MFS) profile domain-containing protein n=1 Tax=Glossina brevipalpis TaxID=37001 RepID=A0A1A9VZI8_9MUSC